VGWPGAGRTTMGGGCGGGGGDVDYNSKARVRPDTATTPLTRGRVCSHSRGCVIIGLTGSPGNTRPGRGSGRQRLMYDWWRRTWWQQEWSQQEQ
jgi:hypothetical protein